MKVLYDCRGCGLKEAEVEVPDRLPNEVVTDWIATVQSYLGVDHHRRSPLCDSGNCDLKIPLAPGSNRIGEPTRN